MNKTAIPWTDFTWTVSRGCSPVSAGCQNCYAASMANRFSGPGGLYEGLAKGGKWTGKVQLCPESIGQPLTRKKPAKIFVNSMSDLFHEQVPFEYIDRVFSVMAMAKQHTFLVLTKRPERAFEWFSRIIPRGGFVPKLDLAVSWPLPNVWFGITTENQKAYDERLPYLVQIPAAKKFISIEPMLEEVHLSLAATCPASSTCGSYQMFYEHINWIVLGCESGSGARPFKEQWARWIRNKCIDYEIPFFYKSGPSEATGKIVSMPTLDGKVWAEFPE